MRRIAFISITILLLFTALAHADLVLYGKVQKFNPSTGRLILITQAEGESEFTISRNTPIFMYIKGKEVQKDWNFLKDNMMLGTKVKLILSRDTVTKLVILEVPQ